ncbi:uncharacterized protein TNCV_3379241 [Trichonephila clavipes]|nr:uncharacterized protein TNCV_3379241 [Trichonephila clavipes]
MLGSRTDLHIFDAGSVNGTRYCNEILLPYVRLFRGAMGLQFFFMDDNAPYHRTVASEQLLESEDIEHVIPNTNSPNFHHSYESGGREFNQQSFQRKPTRFNVSDAAQDPQRCFNCNDIGHLSKSCPNHSRGPRFLSCNLYGHKSFECRRANLNNTSTPPSGVNAVHKLPSAINMCEDVTIFGRKLNGLVDTGSNLTLLRNSTYINRDAPPLKQTNTLSTGFGFSRINVIGTFDSEVTIDDQIFPVNISVVPNSCTIYYLIIGCDKLNKHI